MNPGDRFLLWTRSQWRKLYPDRRRTEVGGERRVAFEQEVVKANVPVPWTRVGLAILPGLFLLLVQSFSWQILSETGVNILGSACLLFLAASSVVLLLPHARPIPVPVWLLIPLGFFAGFGLMFRMGWPGFYEGCLVLVILGLGCARVNGARAALVLLNGGIILASAAIDPGMYLAPGPFARILLLEGVMVLVMILAPILVLRARSMLAQGLALVLPTAAYAAVFSFALLPASGLALPMFQFSLGQALAVASPFIALTGIVAAAALLYGFFPSARLRLQR